MTGIGTDGESGTLGRAAAYPGSARRVDERVALPNAHSGTFPEGAGPRPDRDRRRAVRREGRAAQRGGPFPFANVSFRVRRSDPRRMVMSELADARGRKCLTKFERECLLASASSHPKPAVQTLARTLALTGCRVSDALGLRVCDIDREANEVRIATLKRRRTHWRAVPVPEDPGAGAGARARAPHLDVGSDPDEEARDGRIPKRGACPAKGYLPGRARRARAPGRRNHRRHALHPPAAGPTAYDRSVTPRRRAHLAVWQGSRRPGRVVDPRRAGAPPWRRHPRAGSRGVASGADGGTSGHAVF